MLPEPTCWVYPTLALVRNMRTRNEVLPNGSGSLARSKPGVCILSPRFCRLPHFFRRSSRSKFGVQPRSGRQVGDPYGSGTGRGRGSQCRGRNAGVRHAAAGPAPLAHAAGPLGLAAVQGAAAPIAAVERAADRPDREASRQADAITPAHAQRTVPAANLAETVPERWAGHRGRRLSRSVQAGGPEQRHGFARPENAGEARADREAHAPGKSFLAPGRREKLSAEEPLPAAAAGGGRPCSRKPSKTL